MNQTELQEKTMCSPFLREMVLSPEDVMEKRYPAGTLLSDRPEGISSVGLILSGRVEVDSVALDGKDVQLSSLSAGECFGICNLLEDTEMETVLRCAEDTNILYIPKRTLRTCMEQNPELAFRYARLCNQKIQFLIRRIELLTMQSCKGRVVAWLLSRVDPAGPDGSIQLSGSRDELALQLGISRAALFRELADLQERGWIRVDRDRISIQDRDKLEELPGGSRYIA